MPSNQYKLQLNMPRAHVNVPMVAGNTGSIPVAGNTSSIPVEEFAEHVRQLHANDNYLYTEEYAVS